MSEHGATPVVADVTVLGNGAPPGLDQETIARFTHVGKLPMMARVGLPAAVALEAEAHFIGCTPAELSAIRRRQAQERDSSARVLMEDADLAAHVARLPQDLGPRVVVIGDSVTADTFSWAELLGSAVRQTCVDVELINVSVSGITTADVIGMFELVQQAHPTTILLMVGTNDARRHGSRAKVRIVGAEESTRNLVAVRDLIGAETAARVIALTPAPFNQEKFDGFVPLDHAVSWDAHELGVVAGDICRVFPDVIDVHGGLGDGLDDDFWLPDGLHPDLPGHRLILRHVLRELPGRSS